MKKIHLTVIFVAAVLVPLQTQAAEANKTEGSMKLKSAPAADQSSHADFESEKQKFRDMNKNIERKQAVKSKQQQPAMLAPGESSQK